jgi:uncharacterized cupin superfamily protein
LLSGSEGIEAMTWKNIVNVETVELAPDQGKEPYRYDYNRPATEMGAKKLGFNVATVPAGQFSCPYHFHHSEEELFLVLEGKAMLRQADQYREVSRGDLIFFTTGPEGVHQLYNHTKETFKFLAISTMDPFEVAEYPDSKKIFIAKLKKLFQAGSEVEYYKDEEDPAKHWPKEYL